MLRVTLKSAWSRKRRLIGTVFAIVLGVSFLSATNVLGDSARDGFATVFEEANAGTDAYVRSAQEFTSMEDGSRRSPIPIDIVDVIESIDGVETTAVAVEGTGQVLDSDGDPVGGNGPPTMAAGWIDNPELTGWELIDGRAPETAGEVVLDEATFEDTGANLGGTVTVLVPDATRFTVVGVTNFGDDTSIGGATYAGMLTSQAQELLAGSTDLVSAVIVAADSGVGEEELVNRIEAALPDGLEAITGDELTEEMEDQIEGDFLGFLTTALTIFAAIALVVAAFSIYNTFSILVAQRTRESALLRAIGASRRQVMWSALAESVIVGVVGAVLGAAVGVLLASGVLSLMESVGFGLPTQGLKLTAGAMTTAVIGGLIVTLIGGVVPAWRASRTAPVAALRETALDPGATSWVRAVIGGMITAAGVALVVFTNDGSIVRPGIGAALVVIGVVLLGPVVAGPMATLIGSPIRFRGTAGDLAQRNAVRNPRRTAATATALLVGIGVVSLFTVFGASVKSSLETEVSKTFAGELALEPPGSFSGSGLSPSVLAAVNELPEVEAAAGLGFGAGLVDGENEAITFSDPQALAVVADFEVVEGDLSGISDTDIAMNEEYAEDNGYSVGDSVAVTYTDGATEDLTVAVIYESEAIGGNVLVSANAWLPHTPQSSYFFGLVGLADGVSVDDGKEAVDAATTGQGAPDIMDRNEFIESQAAEIDVVLTVIYVLLAIAVIIALMGIANTMSLSTYERIRELGLLRAVGLTRRQLRSMVRWESVIVATFGSVGGLGIGMFLSWGLVRALNQAEGFGEYTIPFGQLFFVLVIGALVGLLAGLRPAWRASKLNVLEAIAEE